MADLIDRQVIVKDLQDLIKEWLKYPAMKRQITGIEAALNYVKSIPSAQPTIIQCKDCRYWSYCEEVGCKEDDFCSRAEKRTDEMEVSNDHN